MLWAGIAPEFYLGDLGDPDDLDELSDLGDPGDSWYFVCRVPGVLLARLDN